jgi:hypothetical protein
MTVVCSQVGIPFFCIVERCWHLSNLEVLLRYLAPDSNIMSHYEKLNVLSDSRIQEDKIIWKPTNYHHWPVSQNHRKWKLSRHNTRGEFQAEGDAKIFGVFRVKNHDSTLKNQIFSNCGGRGKNCWGISCEKKIVSTSTIKIISVLTR